MGGSVSALHAYSSVRAVRREVDVIYILNLLTTIMLHFSINSNGVSNVLFLISVKSSPVFASYRCLLFTNILIY